MARRDAGALPSLTMRILPEVGDPDDVRYTLAWDPPVGFFAPFRRLHIRGVRGGQPPLHQVDPARGP